MKRRNQALKIQFLNISFTLFETPSHHIQPNFYYFNHGRQQLHNNNIECHNLKNQRVSYSTFNKDCQCSKPLIFIFIVVRLDADKLILKNILSYF